MRRILSQLTRIVSALGEVKGELVQIRESLGRIEGQLTELIEGPSEAMVVLNLGPVSEQDLSPRS